MSDFDVIIIHPPAVYDFRRKPLFPGAMASTVERMQFNKVPIGMLSIAEFLDRHGYKVIVDNLCDRMITIPGFDVERHLKSYSARVFAIGLNFQQHSQGAVEIARMCKKLHPGAQVIMGGLTATRFHTEIIRKYPFVDGVVRAEGEKPMLQLMRTLEAHGRITATPNLTYKDNDGKICVSPLMPASKDLDEFEFTRFDLIDPKTSIFLPDETNRWSLAVCRGCIHNCAICGGSAYTYKKYMGMAQPAFRSPAKIVADMKQIISQGVQFVGLYQDPRMAGKKYWQTLLDTLIKEKPEFERLSLDLLVPADEDFIREIAKIDRRIILHLCPDTGCDAIRNRLGRRYSTEKLIETIKLCHKYRIPVTNFFSVGLAGETEQEVKKTWKLWAELDMMNHEAMARGDFGDIVNTVPIGGQVLGPIVLDPGSQAFDSPEQFGYKLLYKNLEDYIHGLSQPVWDQWLNYETEHLDRDAIVDIIHKSIEFTIDQREKHGFFSPPEAYYERCRVEADRVIIQETKNLMKIKDTREREMRIISMRRNLDNLEKQRMSFLD